MPAPVAPTSSKSPAELLHEQQTLMELINSGAFKWFIATCIRAKRREAEKTALDTGTSEAETTKEKHLRAALLAIETWAEDRKLSNQSALDSLDPEQKPR